MSTTKQGNADNSSLIERNPPNNAFDYLTSDPLAIETSKLFELVESEWDNLDVSRSALKPLRLTDLADLIAHINQSRLYIDETASKYDLGWVFVGKSEISYGATAISAAFILTLEWLRAYVARASAFESQATRKILYEKALDLLSNPKHWRNIREYLWGKIATSADESAKIDYAQLPHLIPCQIATPSANSSKPSISLGHFSLLSGKVTQFSPSGRFPHLSGLTLPSNLLTSPLSPPSNLSSSKFIQFISNLLGAELVRKMSQPGVSKGEMERLREKLQARVDYFLELSAYLCSYGNPKEIIVVMQGDGGNGKSVWLYVMKSILGGLAAKGNKDIYSLKSGDKFGKSEIRNARLAYFSEIPERFSLNTDALKEDSEQYLHSQGKNEKGFEKETSHKSLFVSNYPIEINDRTTATLSRIHYIKTEGQNWRLSEGRIERFNDILCEEEGDLILWLLVEGYKRLMARGKFAVPEEYQGTSAAVVDLTAKEPSAAEEFVAARLEVGLADGCELRAGDLAEQFELFCDLNGMYCDSRVKYTLFKTLTGKGVGRRRDRLGIIYCNVAYAGDKLTKEFVQMAKADVGSAGQGGFDGITELNMG